MPIFHDDRDEVTWLPHHHEPSPPPPPFEPPPERPLFAPDPADGEPARRPRALPVAAQSGGSGFWPWESSGTGAGTGSGVLPAFVDDEEEDDRNPPGTSMLRLALIVAVCLLDPDRLRDRLQPRPRPVPARGGVRHPDAPGPPPARAPPAPAPPRQR